jgi:hypothetical protein
MESHPRYFINGLSDSEAGEQRELSSESSLSEVYSRNRRQFDTFSPHRSVQDCLRLISPSRGCETQLLLAQLLRQRTTSEHVPVDHLSGHTVGRKSVRIFAANRPYRPVCPGRSRVVARGSLCSPLACRGLSGRPRSPPRSRIRWPLSGRPPAAHHRTAVRFFAALCPVRRTNSPRTSVRQYQFSHVGLEYNRQLDSNHSISHRSKPA